MNRLFVSSIRIDKVRHLNSLRIEISEDEMKHLIITGKNGSGKTSLLDALAVFLGSITESNRLTSLVNVLDQDKRFLTYSNDDKNASEIQKTKERIADAKQRIKSLTGGVMLSMTDTPDTVYKRFKQGNFVVAYYKADRAFRAQLPEHVEKVLLKNDYTINETPGDEFIKYLLDMKMTQALAASNGKTEKAERIALWFENFEGLMKRVFEDDSVKLEFDEDTFKFNILMNGKEPFDFNTLSSGYAAIFDIVIDLIIRMEKQTSGVFDFSVPGVVLIDEIETHLHLALQRNILGFLTGIFPNVQFIVSTHSPFIVNSIENAVIYDLEKHITVKDGLSDVPYSGVVEGYFDSDSLSNELRSKFDEYRKLVIKPKLTDDDFEKIAELEFYLEEIPDYLALNLTTEYQRLKAELRRREDV